MENISDDILFYNICYSDHQVAPLFSLICKRFNRISKGYGGEIRDPKTYYTEPMESVEKYGYIGKYYINKFTGKKEGKYVVLDNNKNIRKECYYKDDKKEGKYRTWDTYGYKTKECTYKNGKLNGKYISMYQAGFKYKECTYINGKLNGKYQQWYPDGNKHIKCHYINDILEGKYEVWYYNGTKETKCYYKNGIKERISTDELYDTMIRYGFLI